MGKNKILSLAIIVTTTLCLLAGITYSWFVDKVDSVAVTVSTGDIDLCITPLVGDFNKLPGESVWVNPLYGTFLNKGTRNGIVELSFDNNISATLATGQAPSASFLGDYINEGGVWKYGPTRLSKVSSMEMKDGTFEMKGWKKIGNKYYGIVETSNTILLGKIYLNISNELGGFYKDPTNNNIQSPSRQFEQGTAFKVSYTAKTIQATKQAVADYFGQTVADTIPNTWYDK